jgi:hypothetical protein
VKDFGAEEVADLSITIGSLPLSCTTTLILPILTTVSALDFLSHHLVALLASFPSHDIPSM